MTCGTKAVTILGAVRNFLVLKAWRAGLLSDRRFVASRFGGGDPHVGALRFAKERGGRKTRIGWTGTVLVRHGSWMLKLPLNAVAEALIKREHSASQRADRLLEDSIVRVYDTEIIEIDGICGLRVPYLHSETDVKVTYAYTVWKRLRESSKYGPFRDVEHECSRGLRVLHDFCGPKMKRCFERIYETVDLHGPIGITHGDYTIKNMIRSDGAVTLIDLDRWDERGFQLFDVAHLFVQAMVERHGEPWPSIVARIMKDPKQATANARSVFAVDDGRNGGVGKFSASGFWVVYFLDRLGKEYRGMNKVLDRWKWIVQDGVRRMVKRL